MKSSCSLLRSPIGLDVTIRERRTRDHAPQNNEDVSRDHIQPSQTLCRQSLLQISQDDNIERTNPKIYSRQRSLWSAVQPWIPQPLLYLDVLFPRKSLLWKAAFLQHNKWSLKMHPTPLNSSLIKYRKPWENEWSSEAWLSGFKKTMKQVRESCFPSYCGAEELDGVVGEQKIIFD